jgi:hypothetical protein
VVQVFFFWDVLLLALLGVGAAFLLGSSFVLRLLRR